MFSMASEMQELAARLMKEARQRVQPDDMKLARLIEPLVGRLYGRQSVGGWARGDINVPAYVLLAACRVTGISIDEQLFGESLLQRTAKLEDGLRELERQIAALQAR